MDILYIALIICIIIIFILFFGICRISKYIDTYTNFRIPSHINISEIYDDLKSGDIILFASTIINLSNILLSHIFYTHIGILIRINDIMYISETNPAIEFMPKNGKSTYNTSYDEIRTNNGADILPLLPKLKFFTGDYFIMQLSRPLNQNREELLIQTAKDLFNDNYPYPTLFQGLVAIMGKKIKARHCMLHVAHILDKLQLTLDYEQSGFLSICKKITELSNIKLNDNYYYNNITQILYDI